MTVSIAFSHPIHAAGVAVPCDTSLSIAARPKAALTPRNMQRQEKQLVSKSVQKSYSTEEVGEAAEWASFLVECAQKNSGMDQDSAISAAARKADIPRSRLYSLVRRPQSLKDIGASIYTRLYRAYVAERSRQAEALQHELELLRAAGRDRSPVARAAARVAGMALAEPEVKR